MARLALLVTASVACVAAAASRPELASAPSPAPDAPRTPVLVELFTSQGCSSCPPADGLLASLLRDQPVAGAAIVTLSEHVDVWDHLGWKDPFSSPIFTRRQEAYGRRWHRDAIYTPQWVIDGTTDVAGSDEPAVRRAIAEAARRPKGRLRLALSARGADRIEVTVQGELTEEAAEPADVQVALAENDLSVRVTGGENARRTLRHVSVVRTLITGATRQDGPRLTTTASLDVPRDVRRDQLRVIVFAHSRATGRVVGVGWNPD